MITDIQHFLHTVYRAQHVFISPSQEPHRGDYYGHWPILQVRKLRFKEPGWVVFGPTTSGQSQHCEACLPPYQYAEHPKGHFPVSWFQFVASMFGSHSQVLGSPSPPHPCPLSQRDQKPFLYFPLKTSMRHLELSQPAPGEPWSLVRCPGRPAFPAATNAESLVPASLLGSRWGFHIPVAWVGSGKGVLIVITTPWNSRRGTRVGMGERGGAFG